jgi:hypothetical protein
VLVLPLSIPVLIFGVAASQAAISGPLSFGTPFSILCAISLGQLCRSDRLPQPPACDTAWIKFDVDQLSRSRNETKQAALPAPPPDDYQDGHDADRPRQPDQIPLSLTSRICRGWRARPRSCC